jgi:choice-of-anchor A domain-containing protein
MMNQTPYQSNQSFAQTTRWSRAAFIALAMSVVTSFPACAPEGDEAANATMSQPQQVLEAGLMAAPIDVSPEQSGPEQKSGLVSASEIATAQMEVADISLEAHAARFSAEQLAQFQATSKDDEPAFQATCNPYVKPVFECIQELPGGVLKAVWGYNNTSNKNQSEPLGTYNKFTPNPSNRGQPVSFLPGRQAYVFTTDVPASGNLVWTLGTGTATANKNSVRCKKPITPIVECVEEVGTDKLKAKFSYNNQNAFSVTMPIPTFNYMSPGTADKGQPVNLASGLNKFVYELTFPKNESRSWTLLAGGNLKTATADKNSPRCQCAGGTFNFGLGAAQDYNVFACGDYTGAEDVLGKVAAAGNVDFNGFSIAGSNPGGNALIVGGIAKLRNGTVYGNLKYGTSADLDNTVDFQSGGSASQGSPIDFTAACADMNARSAAMGTLFGNGAVGIPPSKVLMKGADPLLNIFTLSAAQLVGLTEMTIEAPAGSKVLVNMPGTSLTFAGFEIRYAGGVTRQDTVFNAYEATAISMTSIGFNGTLLAPKATLTINGASFWGTVIAKNVVGNGEFYNYPFQGQLTYNGPCPPIPPTDNSKCQVKYSVQDTWPTGYRAEIEVFYTGSVLNGWEFEWDFSTDEVLTSGWNASYDQDVSQVSALSLPWNGTVFSGESFKLGFVAEGTSVDTVDPEWFRLNGRLCTLK